MAIIHKKITTEYFNLIESEKKKFEFRLADFDIAEGDILVLEEWEGEGDTRRPTGRVIEKVATYVLKGRLNMFGQEEALRENGFYVIQFE